MHESSEEQGSEAPSPPLLGEASPLALLEMAKASVAIAMEEEDLDRVVEEVLAQGTALGALESALFLVDESRQVLRFISSSVPLPAELGPYLDELPLDHPQSYLIEVLRSRRLHLRHRSDPPREGFPGLASFMGSRGTLLLAPLISRGRPIGLIGWSLAEERVFAEWEREQIERIAAVLAGALDNRLIWERLRKEVSERRAAEEQARASEAFLQKVIEHAPVGVLLARPSGELEINERTKQLFGRSIGSQEELASLSPFIRREDGSQVPAEEVQSWLHQHHTKGLETLTLLRPDGSQVPVLRRAGPILGQDGELLGGVAILQDISPLREIERLRSRWTTLIAHDLKQPLTVITTYAGLLARQSSEETKRQRAEAILSASKGLARMISDLSEASRLQSKDLSLRLVPLQPAPFVREVCERFLGEKGEHPLCLDLSDELPPLEADPLRLEQVLWNLLSNAIKYGSPGSKIEVCAAPGRGFVTFAVANEGPPLDPRDLPHLFKRFFRAEREATSKTRGLGLGLYIARGLVEAHGGKIWAESRDGKNVFCFTLPAQSGP